MNNKYEIARDKFENRIKKGMLGPGSEYWGVSEMEELISDYPLIRYFTGILFPKKKMEKNQFEVDINSLESDTSFDEEDMNDINDINNETSLQNDNEQKAISPDRSEKEYNNNDFFPNNIGITVCLNDNVKQIKVVFCFGLYHQVLDSENEKKFKLPQKEYDLILNFNNELEFPLYDKIKHDGTYLYLSKKIEGNASRKSGERSGDYKKYDEWKSNLHQKTREKLRITEIIDKLISSRVWKREDFKITKIIDIDSMLKQESLILDGKKNKHARIKYSLKRYNYKGNKYIKIQLINDSEEHPSNRFSNKSEKLNAKCIFQTEIKIYSDGIKPYRGYNDFNNLDEEEAQLNYIYRSVNSYGIGHNCSVSWDNNTVSSNFLPSVELNTITNNIPYQIEEDIFNIKNLSMWGYKKETVIKNLKKFIIFYEQWISTQIKKVEKENNNDIGLNIIDKQQECLKRLKKNIYLLEDDKIFYAFQLTNLVMLIQFLISNNKEIGEPERELAQVLEEYPEKLDINYLQIIYNNIKEEKKPRYRPFQLAFLILSLDSITNEQSKYRKDIVDLIWFPTGGGKTEAYLAVAAFVIIWRRMTKENSEGTSVIMRYTLRLLTAQQFERASKMITALEFLRRQNEYRKILGEEQITIGLWVGQGVTPNKYEDSDKIIQDINKKLDDKESNIEEGNKFQLSSCPWCGTKLITRKEDETWLSGFDGNKRFFKISCNNKKCEFYNGLPINVIDQALYKDPPTLLFGTLDKFATLAKQENGHRLFNINDSAKYPPDLIIQDELHLINGPLGSISGLYESLIELLCTKDGIGPKIISSTATTRNSAYQVSKLYGNRDVHIFPPTGIEYDDCFFSKASTESKRKYIGFLPTGKTVVDTQLHILAHLLLARMEVYGDKDINEVVKDYWTIISYYSSLRDVGRTMNKINDEITDFTSTLHNRHASIVNGIEIDNQFHYHGLINRTKELTSRIPSEKIKLTLKEIEQEFDENKCIKTSDKGYKYLNGVVDLVLATNMLSVGIDIKKLNLMLVNGMPMNNAEYIQATSRVARKNEGLVITLFNSNKGREKSFYEHFMQYHQTFYKEVEPISVTPFTENTLKKMLSTIVIAFLRSKYPGKMNKDNDLKNFEPEDLDILSDFMESRFKKNNTDELQYFKNQMTLIKKDILMKINDYNFHKYRDLFSNEIKNSTDQINWYIMNSLREIDSSTFIKKIQYR